MNLLVHVAKGYFWSQFGRLGEVGLFFLLSLVLAREMGPSAYGIFALGLSLTVFFGALAAMGIGQEALGKFVPEAAAGRYPGGVARLVGQLLGIRVMAVVTLSGLVLLAGGWLERGLGVAGFRSNLNFILLVFSLRSLCELFACAFSGLLELRVVAASRAVVPLVALAWVAGHRLEGERVAVNDAFGALALGQLVALLLFILAARKSVPAHVNHPDGQSSGLRRVLSFGLFVWLSAFFIFVLGDSSDVALIGWLIKDARATGYYAVGSSVVYRGVTLLLAWLPLIGTSTACNAYLEGGKERLSETAEAVWKLIAISLIPPMFLLFQFSDAFVTLLYSEQYRAAVPVLRILAALFAVSAILGHGLQAGILYILDRERSACAIFGAAAFCNLFLGIFLIKKFGITGAAWATGLSFVFFSGLCSVVGATVNPVPWPWRFSLKVLSASGVAVLSTLWLTPRGTVGSLGAACAMWGLIFVLTFALTKPLSTRDSNSLRLVSPQLGYVLERFFVRAV